MIERTEYLEKLKSLKDKKVVKIITGIRGCGKSTLLQMYRDHLLDTEISEEQIVVINFESLEFENLLNDKKLHQYLVSRLVPLHATYGNTAQRLYVRCAVRFFVR